MTISEYYKYYLTLHEHPKCKLLHFIGQWVTLFFTIVVIYNNIWYLIPLIPFIIYPFAWSGHYFFENNKPAAFKEPIKFIPIVIGVYIASTYIDLNLSLQIFARMKHKDKEKNVFNTTLNNRRSCHNKCLLDNTEKNN